MWPTIKRSWDRNQCPLFVKIWNYENGFGKKFDLDHCLFCFLFYLIVQNWCKTFRFIFGTCQFGRICNWPTAWCIKIWIWTMPYLWVRITGKRSLILAQLIEQIWNEKKQLKRERDCQYDNQQDLYNLSFLCWQNWNNLISKFFVCMRTMTFHTKSHCCDQFCIDKFLSSPFRRSKLMIGRPTFYRLKYKFETVFTFIPMHNTPRLSQVKIFICFETDSSLF